MIKNIMEGLLNHRFEISLNEIKRLEQFTDGLSAGFVAIGAEPSVGKTQLMCQLALDIVRCNHDGKVLMLNLDDSLTTTFVRVLASLTGIPHSLVKNPNKIEHEEIKDHLDKGIETIHKLEEAQRLTVLSESEAFKQFSPSRNAFEQRLKSLKKLVENAHNENKKLVLIIDHASNTYAVAAGSESENAGRLATFLKYLAHHFNIPVIATLETTKQKSESSQLKGSAKINYAPDCILHISKDSENPESLVRMEVTKNKMTGSMGHTEFHWDKTKTNFVEKHGEVRSISLKPEDIKLKSLEGFFPAMKR